MVFVLPKPPPPKIRICTGRPTSGSDAFPAISFPKASRCCSVSASRLGCSTSYAGLQIVGNQRNRDSLFPGQARFVAQALGVNDWTQGQKVLRFVGHDFHGSFLRNCLSLIRRILPNARVNGRSRVLISRLFEQVAMSGQRCYFLVLCSTKP